MLLNIGKQNVFVYSNVLTNNPTQPCDKIQIDIRLYVPYVVTYAVKMARPPVSMTAESELTLMA